MTTLYITHECFLDHDTGPGHPERADRLRAIDKVLINELYIPLQREEASEGSDEVIARVHPSAYIKALREASPESGEVYLDNDTLMSPGSLKAALYAVGAAVRATDAVMTREAGTAFVASRPPGHHAEPERPMGFCLFSNAAIAAQHARAAHGAERVAVIDFDVHHGNGTQAAFWSEPDLFYASAHQMPLYPGTGALKETGIADNIVNAPLSAGDGGEKFREAFTSRVFPALIDFGPDLIIISAGFDGHRDDPLASLNLVENDFAWITYKLADIAHKSCSGRMISLLEGGYHLTALAQSTGVHVAALIEAGR